MIIFTTPSFKLDFSGLNIQFSEENTFFEKNLIKQYSFPFEVPLECSFFPFFEFVSSHNSIASNKYIEGVLFRNDKYYEAELLIISIGKTIKTVIYYSFDKLTIFDKSLKSLPWSTLNLDTDIYTYAGETILKNYPETPINFTKIYDPEKYKDYDWGVYEGFINNASDGEFQKTLSNYYQGFEIPGLNRQVMNELRPFLYVREIVKFIFEQVDYTIAGDFISDISIARCLQYHNNTIFYTNEAFEKIVPVSLSINTSNVVSSPVVYNEYIQEISFSAAASYKIILDLEGDFATDNEEITIKSYFDGTLVSSELYRANTSSSFSTKSDFFLHLTPTNFTQKLEIKIVCSDATKSSIEGNTEIKGTARPLYKDTIFFGDLLPDISVGSYIQSIQETFNLSVVFDEPTKTVTIDFFNSFVDSKPAIDLSKYEAVEPFRKLNTTTGYKILFEDGEQLNFNKYGEYTAVSAGFESNPIPLQTLPIVVIDAVSNVQHQSATSILFFKSNSNALPIVNDAENDYSYTREGFINLFLKRWFFQQLNSEEYMQTFYLPIYISSKINEQSKLWIYNNFFVVKNIKRLNINPLFEKLTVNFLKFKSEDYEEDTTYLPPSAFLSSSFTSTILQTDFNVVITPGSFGLPASFSLDLFANNSTDPQDFPLSYGWEVISSPTGEGLGTFTPQNSEHSITKFTHSSYLILVGVYQLKLTVINSEGLSDSINFSVNVTAPSAPDPSVVLTQTSVLSSHFGAALNFTPINTTGILEAQNVTVNFATGVVTPIGSVLTFNFPNLIHGVNSIDTNLPSTSSNYWYLKLIVDNIESNDRPLASASLPFNIE